MKLVLVVVLNAIVSVAVSIGVLYWAPGYAPSPKEVIFAGNANTMAITKLSESVGEVIKRMNEIAPPIKEGNVKDDSPHRAPK